jgi:hypothetical protein
LVGEIVPSPFGNCNRNAVLVLTKERKRKDIKRGGTVWGRDYCSRKDTLLYPEGTFLPGKSLPPFLSPLLSVVPSFG